MRFSIDQFKAGFQWRGDDPDPEPHYGLVFLVLLPIVAGVGAVAWLGWSWPALVVTAVATFAIGGLALRRWIRNSRRERSQIPEWR